MSLSLESTGSNSLEDLGPRDLRRKRSPISVVRDYVELTKPAINRMCLLMTAGGMFLAPRAADGAFPLPVGSALLALLGTALAVASANALNMWLERDTDRLMRRTKERPLAEGRISASGAFYFGLALGLVSVLVLAISTNLATTLTGLFAIVSYVAIYTPLKYVHPLALVVGAIPGAVPPLMGWTAVTGHFDLPGLVLFAVLFVWQMPHFIAISVVRRRDYDAAGIRTVPGLRGMVVARWQALAWALLLTPTSLALVWTGVSGWLYGTFALVAGLAFLAMTASGFKRGIADNRWGQRLFVASIIYLPVLITGLAIDVLL
ncbi:MAG: protoheme IX farnesyltransferase [Deltaproteobacteria bacterium]|jgi:protoheme IX farnesyltransferase|nr:protoheme IX farnesyltransferase [Deltaproteobacteria bacterium]